MNVRNCRKCRRLFNYVAGPYLCTACREEMEAKFQEVKQYIEEHRHADIRQVAEVCEVDPIQIHQWIKEERLCFSDDSPIGIPCERCGKTIKVGRFCDKCKAEMSNSFNELLHSSSKEMAPVKRGSSSNPRMHYLD